MGDSRAYLLRDRRLRQLTHDHSLVQSLVDQGRLSPAAAETHPDSHIVTRAVGGGPEIDIDRIAQPLVAGDRLLLCSDGLTRVVPDGPVETILAATPDPFDAAQALIRAALDNGAPDNVSVIVVDVGAG